MRHIKIECSAFLYGRVHKPCYPRPTLSKIAPIPGIVGDVSPPIRPVSAFSRCSLVSGGTGKGRRVSVLSFGFFGDAVIGFPFQEILIPADTVGAFQFE